MDGYGSSQSAAAAAAVKNCGVADCRDLDWFHNAVASFAKSANGAYGTGNGWSNNITVAEDNSYKYAIQSCQQYGGTDCQVTESWQTPTVSSSGSGGPWTYQAGNYAGWSGTVSVNTSFHEPNTAADVNYCGPGASQVLISNWTKNVPSIDTLAAEEKTIRTGPNAGTLISNMVTPINDAIGTGYYAGLGGASNQEAFSNLIAENILNGHPLITGIMTGVGNTYLNGWQPVKQGGGSGYQVSHIVTIYGFDFTSPASGKIYYVETAGTVSGTNKTGPQVIDYQSFWTLVYANNTQLARAG